MCEQQLPVGMTLNVSTEISQRISSWTSRISDEGLAFIIHDQGWCMTMNRISPDYDLLNSGNMSFEWGGFQGANVNRLADKDAVNNQPIMTGSYYFDGIFDELDVVGMFFSEYLLSQVHDHMSRRMVFQQNDKIFVLFPK